MNKNFDYEIIYEEYVIEIMNYNEESFSVSLDDFWDFVYKHGFHEYCNDYYDPSEHDGHGQKSGELTREEYFEYVDDNSLKHDLAIYLKKKHNNLPND